MFIDLCFPKGNEEEFIEVAKKIKTTNLCFIKNNMISFNFKSNHPIPKIFGFGEEVKQKSVCLVRNIEQKRRFNSPMDMNEVYIKEIKEKSCILCFSFNELYSNPINLEKIRFIARLARKYNLRIMVASCANTPLNLRSKADLEYFSKFIGINEDTKESFYGFLTQGF